MTWDIEMVGLLRVMLMDLALPYNYCDESLKKLIVFCAQKVMFDADGNFIANFVADIVSVTITPDPCDRAGGTRDDNFIMLTLLQAACILDNSEARSAAKRAFMAKEFSSTIDIRPAAEARLKILQIGWCKEYEDSLFNYLAGNVSIGVAVLGPFRTVYTAYAADNSYANTLNQELFRR